MTTRPTAPIIIITDGYLHEDSIAGSIATPVHIDFPEDGYYLITGPRTGWNINPALNVGEIAAWSPCVAVPNEVIDKLHAAFYDNIMTPEQREAFQAFEAYIH